MNILIFCSFLIPSFYLISEKVKLSEIGVEFQINHDNESFRLFITLTKIVEHNKSCFGLWAATLTQFLRRVLLVPPLSAPLCWGSRWRCVEGSKRGEGEAWRLSSGLSPLYPPSLGSMFPASRRRLGRKRKGVVELVSHLWTRRGVSGWRAVVLLFITKLPSSLCLCLSLSVPLRITLSLSIVSARYLPWPQSMYSFFISL